jgi:hypothetical protein
MGGCICVVTIFGVLFEKNRAKKSIEERSRFPAFTFMEYFYVPSGY